MNLNFNISEFSQIDQKFNEIRKLASYDPLLSIIKERFQQQITHHLTSLKTKNSSLSPEKEKAANSQSMKQAYLVIGKEHAIAQLIFDLANRNLTTATILLLAEILFEETNYRNKEVFILNISGNRQSTPKANEVVDEMEKLINWYYEAEKKEKINPIIRATYLHYKITSIRPFTDWNGRIARLLLNISLMNSGLLPILIAPNDRLTYYESLEMADKGNLDQLIRFIATKELETIDEFMNSPEYLSIKGKFELKEQLKIVGGHEKCIVLTEDSATQNLIETLLVASGFNLKETNVISYEGCSKIGSANLFSIFVKEKMPNVKILVHRDRDYLTDTELSLQNESFRRIDTKLFITSGTDVESYFLNAQHITYCYPAINIDVAEKLIHECMDEVFTKSVDYLRKKEFGGHKTEIHTHLNKALEELVSHNMRRFTHGKTALKILQYKLYDLSNKRYNLEQPSSFLKIDELQSFAKTIWPENFKK